MEAKPALCECGCGQKAPFAQRTNRTYGHIKGNPVRFVPGHNFRGTTSIATRFQTRIDVRGPAECWEWTGGKVPAGYGAIWDNSIEQNRLTHRVAWELANGQVVPAGLFVCHRCDNPPCCNPAHLFLGTQADNDADRTVKGRSARGERHVDSKLTDESVRTIRALAATGWLQKDLARAYGVSTSTLHAVVNRKTWRHVT